MDDLNILLKATLDINKSVDNINKQILQVQDKLKNVNISLNIDDFKNELEKAFGSIESKVKKTKENKLEFQGIKETAKQIKELSGSLENIYKDLKKVGDVKSLKNIYDTDGNVSGFNLQLEKTMGNLKEISNYNVFGQYNKETKEYEYALTKVNSTLKEIDNSNKKIGETNKKSSQMSNAKNLQAYYDNARKYVLEVEKGAMDATEALAKLESVMMKSDKSGFTWQFDGLSMQQQKSILADRNKLENQILQSKKAQYNVEKQIEQSQIKQENQIREIALLKKQINSSIDNIVNNNDRADIKKANELKDALSKIPPEASDARLQIRELKASVSEYASESRSASTVSNSFSDSLKRFTAFYGIHEIFQLGARAIRSMTEALLELDGVILEVQKVAQIPNMDNFVKQSYAAADALKILGTEFISGVGEASRMGYSLDEAFDMSTVANKMVIVGDGIRDVEQAMGVLQSSLALFSEKGYNAEDVLNLLNETANNTGVSFGELSDMLSRSASVGLSGSSLESIIALNTALFEVTRNAEMSASSINMINQRIQGLDIETGEQSVELISKMNDELIALTGVEIYDKVNGGLKDTATVLEQVAGVWNSLDKTTKSATATLIGNNRHAKAVSAIMSNFDTYYKSLDASMSSANSSQKELQAYLDSTTGKVEAMKGAMQELWVGTLSSNLVGDIAETTTNIIKLITELGGLSPILTTILSTVILIKAQSISGWLVGMVGYVKDTAKAMMSVKVATDATSVSATKLQAAMGWIGLIGVSISAMVMMFNKASKEIEELENDVKNLNKEMSDLSSEKNNTVQLATQYEELKKLADAQKLTNEQQEEFTRIQNQLHDIMPSINGYFDEQNNFLITESEVLKEVNEYYKAYVDLKREERAEKSKELLDSRISTYKRSSDDIKTLKADLEDLYKYKKYLESDRSNTNGLSTDKILDLDGQMEYYTNGIDGAISFASDTIREHSTIMNDASKSIQQDLMNIAYTTDAWTNSTSEQKQAISNMIQSLDSIDDMEKYFKDTENSISKFSNGFDSALKSTRQFSDGTISIAQHMSNLSSASAITGISVGELEDIVYEYIETVNNATDATDNYVASSERINTVIDESKDKIATYNDLMQKMQEGTYLTAEEMYNLVDSNAELAPMLEEVDGMYRINIDSLGDLRDTAIQTTKDKIKADLDDIESVRNKTMANIQSYGIEIESLKSLAEARQALSSSINSVMSGSGSTSDKYNQMLSQGLLSKDLDDSLKSYYEIDSKYKEIQAKMKALENMSFGTKSSSGGSKKGGKDKPSDKFKTDLEEIKLIREQIQREIDLIQEKMNLAELTGDTKTFDELANKMTVLKDELRGISEIEISKFNGLAQIYKETEQLAELESLLASARKQGIIDEISYQEQLISIIEKRSEIEKRAYDDKLRQLNYEQEYTHEDSQEYADIEQQKLYMVLDMQNQYMDKIRRLKESGLSDESEHVRKYIDLYKDMLEEQLNLEKSMAEKRKQLELDRLNDLQKDLGDKQSAMKSYIDMVMQMLRDQYNEEKKMIEDNYKLKQDKLKEELNSYKKIIDAKKKSLEDEANTEDYNDEVAKRQKELADMKANAALLGKDETAKAQYKKLLEEIAQKEKDLAKYQRDHNIKLQQESLDKEYDIYEENINKELDALEQQKDKELEHVQKMLDSEVELRRKAIQLIEKDNDKLYKQLQKWAAETGKKTKDEVENAWLGCTDAINIYNNGQMNVLDTLTKIAEKLKEVKFDIESVNDSHWTDFDNNSSTGNGGSYNKPSGGNNGSFTSARDKKVQEMIELGNQMKGKKKEEVDKLLAQQQKIASEIGAFFENDTWYLMIGGKKVPIRQSIGMRHNGLIGGRVGDGMKANEKLMKLTTDEWVINDKQYKMLNKNIDSLIGGKSNGDITVTFDTLMKVDKIEKDVDVDGLLKRANDMFVRTIKSTFNMRGIK